MTEPLMDALTLDDLAAHPTAQAAAALAAGALGRTAKLTIGGVDCYVTVGYAGPRPIHVDLTLGHGAGLHSYADPVANELATLALDDARAALEVGCRQASALLQCGAWELADLIDAWRGTRFSPAGVCPQVQGVVSSPLDAAARWLAIPPPA
jgi:hypothetical protein